MPGTSAAERDARRTRWERRTDRPLLVLAVLFLVTVLVPYAVRLTPAQSQALQVVDAVVWAAFALDYAVRLALSARRWEFVRTHPLDLVVIVLPLLRPLRALHLLRLLRVGALFAVAHRRARSGRLGVGASVTGATALVVSLAAVAELEAERSAENANIRTLPDALWWAVATVTTVGYGDRYPVTALGRLIAVGLMLVGIALIGLVTATIATWFVGRLRDVQAAEQRNEATLHDVLAELREVRARLDALEPDGRAPPPVDQTTARSSSVPARRSENAADRRQVVHAPPPGGGS